MAGQGKLRRDLKRMFKHMPGYEYVKLDYKSHGGHAELIYMKNGIKMSTYMGVNRSSTSTVRMVKNNLLKDRECKVL